MTSKKKMPVEHRIVLGAVLIMISAWVWTNLPRLAAGQNGALSFFLGTLFALALIFRPKLSNEGFKLPGWGLGLSGIGGSLLAILGMIIPVHQLEWLGILIILYAALAWALPRRYAKDLILAMFLIYWIHPLPSQIFGPIQLEMQSLSVKLSEGLLHALNIRVWGDDLVLRIGPRVFGVPEACSGMKTAVTVFFCGLGVGLLMRFGKWTLLSLLTIGMVQVLLLNVIRISGMVWIGKDKPAGWNEQALHDTMGIFLLLAVGLIHLDAVLIRQWLAYRQRQTVLRVINDEVGEEEEKLRRWPTFWRYAFLWWKPVAVLALLISLATLFYVRLSIAHRAEMIRGVAQGLATFDLENAQRAIQAALVLSPDNDALLLDLARIKVSRGKQEEGLRIIQRKPVQQRTVEERVLEARALLELKRLTETAETVASFPPEARRLPGVALVLTEFYSLLDKPAEVATYAILAARGVGNQERLRSLFPYMATRDLWDTIRLTDSDAPYATAIQGVIAVESRLRIGDSTGAADVLRRAMKNRALEPIFLNPAIRIMRDRPEPEWQTLFESIFMTNLTILKASDLTLAMDGGFSIGRPDIGWLAYTRLTTIAPDDPMLLIAPAEYSRKWFQFRHDALGVGGYGETMVDAKPFFQLAAGQSPWKQLWARIPLANNLGGLITRDGYNQQLKLCLSALKAMEARNALDTRLKLLWGRVLGELGRWDEAHEKLNHFEGKSPRQHALYLTAHAELYKTQGDWEMCFESLAEYVRTEAHPPLTVWLDLAHAAMSLDLGSFAMGCMEEARHDFPESEEWSLAFAGMWSFFGFSEDALFVINNMKKTPHPSIRAKALLATGRITEGQKLILVENLNDLPIPKRQTELLQPAEWTLEWQGGTLTPDDYALERKALKPRQTPFLKALQAKKAAWYEARGQGPSSEVSSWSSLGRDPREKALALGDLTILLLRQNRTNEASTAIAKALEFQPHSTLLNRLNVLIHKTPTTTQLAVSRQPLDSELWLANLVTHVTSGLAPDWVDQEIRKAVNNRLYPPGTLVRAGTFLLRHNFTNAAALSARYAIKEGQGLLPADVLGVMTALKIKDETWALACARAGTEHALEPWPFYKIITGLKLSTKKTDPDLIHALEGLASHYPEESAWVERLGEVYFQSGQTDRALGVLEDALAREAGHKQSLPKTHLLAAEAARREGNIPRAIKILKDAYVRHPTDMSVLNNLIFTLAQDPMYVSEALTLLPTLLKNQNNNFAIHDTAALVYLRAGNLVEAEKHMLQALTLVKKGDYAWLEVYLNAAEAQLRMGKLREAHESLSLIFKSPERSSIIDARARALQDELSRKEREQSKWF